MVFFLRKGLLWLAGALLLAHSFVPHGHEKPPLAQEHENRWNVSTPALPGHPLEADLGAEHLENYRVDEQTLAFSFATDGEADCFVKFEGVSPSSKSSSMTDGYDVPKGEPRSGSLSRLFFLAAGVNRPPPSAV